MESRLANIAPEPRFCVTPPLEPWLGDIPPSASTDTGDYFKEFESLQESIDATKNVLSIDCGRALENAKKAIAKANKPLN